MCIFSWISIIWSYLRVNVLILINEDIVYEMFKDIVMILFLADGAVRVYLHSLYKLAYRAYSHSWNQAYCTVNENPLVYQGPSFPAEPLFQCSSPSTRLPKTLLSSSGPQLSLSTLPLVFLADAYDSTNSLFEEENRTGCLTQLCASLCSVHFHSLCPFVSLIVF